jgi:hypothetical protein
MQTFLASPASQMRAIKTLFFAEIALSPVVAGFAYVVPVAAHWGVFKYVPAILWLVILFQCLFTFRWRGLWFLLGPPIAIIAIIAIVAFLLAAHVVHRSAVPDRASTYSASKLMITPNPNGTFTVQKTPPNWNSKDAKANNGLVIPAQVVTPIAPIARRKQGAPPPP